MRGNFIRLHFIRKGFVHISSWIQKVIILFMIKSCFAICMTVCVSTNCVLESQVVHALELSDSCQAKCE